VTGQARPTDTVRFAREWNFALALVLVAAGLLFAASYATAGAIAVGLGAAALAARWNAMRKQGRGFYGQERRPANAKKMRRGGRHD
jgi:hypothetical protein